MVDRSKQPKIEGVDAVAGATIKEVKESVVAGALYSCYTAWHFVHGAVKDKIKKHTLSMIDEEMVLRMVDSNNSDYQLFALKNLDERQYEENYLRIAQVFRTGIPLVHNFIIKNLRESFWNSEKSQKPFWDSFSQVDINSRSLLLEHLEQAPESIVTELSKQLNVMTKNQLKLYLEHLTALEKLIPRSKPI